MLLKNFSRSIFLFVLALAFCSLTACKENTKDKKTDVVIGLNESNPNTSNIKYAVGFDIEDRSDFKLLHLFRHFNDDKDTVTYLIVNKNASVDLKDKKYPVIRTPVDNVVLLHTSYLAFFEFSNALKTIKAISEIDYVYQPEIRSKISQELLPEIGHSEHLNKEALITLNPELVITVGFPNSPNKNKEQLESLGYPVLVLSEWQESTLLGRMEWVKIFGVLFNRDSIVNARFNAIEEKYLDLKDLVTETKARPRVICNAPFKESWYVPAGNSYVGNVIADAGADYLWKKTTGTGGIPLDYETVFAKANSVDYWINPGHFTLKSKLLEKDERLKEFKAIQNDHVFNCYKRSSEEGENDYWESGLVNPHLILADLLKIFHPEVLPEHELYYYLKLGN